ncbi:hypothetical protein [uncultured Clostridium sp.]|uniref:hypothetical protein n=1 Tax=uncultured Clostridium sp. TaxID=59620 RepID=UPI0026F3D6A3|nr:hypothetical protein [uncultured Clostridium sp.]
MTVSISDVKSMINQRQNYMNTRQEQQPVQPSYINQRQEQPSYVPQSTGADTNLNFQKLNIDVTPVVIQDINDSTGRLSTRLEELEDCCGVGVLLYDATRLLPQVKNLKRHEFLYIQGKRYTSGLSRVVNRQGLDATINSVKTSLESAMPYTENLMVTANLNGMDFRTLKFNSYELSYLVTLFANYNAQVKVDMNGDIILKVGSYE